MVGGIGNFCRSSPKNVQNLTISGSDFGVSFPKRRKNRGFFEKSYIGHFNCFCRFSQNLEKMPENAKNFLFCKLLKINSG